MDYFGLFWIIFAYILYYGILTSSLKNWKFDNVNFIFSVIIKRSLESEFKMQEDRAEIYQFIPVYNNSGQEILMKIKLIK